VFFGGFTGGISLVCRIIGSPLSSTKEHFVDLLLLQNALIAVNNPK